MKYIDTRKTGFKNYPMIARVSQMGYPFPIIAVNGQPKFAGDINEEQILGIIEEMLA